MKRKLIILVISIFVMLCTQPAYAIQPVKDSKELQFQDMLVLFLLPYMNDKLSEVYAPLLRTAPVLYPYFVEVNEVRRVKGFRGFDFLITVEAYPTVGPHISVGEDLFTFDISPYDVKLVEFEHVKGPDPSDFPPNYMDLLK